MHDDTRCFWFMRWYIYNLHNIYIYISLLLLNLILVILVIVTTTIVVIAIDIAMVLVVIRISLIIINLHSSLLPFLLLLLLIHHQFIFSPLSTNAHHIYRVGSTRGALHPLSVSPFRPAARPITSKVTQRNQKLFGVCQDSVIITQRGGIKV